MTARFIVSGDGRFRLPVEEVAGLPAVDVLCLGEALGYGRPDRLRRQVLENWTDMREGDHYLLAGAEKRMKLLPLGLETVLARSSKPGAALILAAVLDRPRVARGPRLATPQADVEVVDDLPPGSLEERKFRYSATQTCLRQLSELTDPLARTLAVEALEVALGRSRPDLRAKIALAEDPISPGDREPSSITPAESLGIPGGSSSEALKSSAQELDQALEQLPGDTSGPFFRQEGWYGFGRIGQMAGGYSAIAAGRAADVVGARLGHTHEQIRHAQLPFNTRQRLPDNTSGKLRPQTRYNRAFANAVVAELRRNPEFTPDEPEPQQGLVPFGSPSNGPRLSRGPFEEDEPGTTRGT